MEWNDSIENPEKEKSRLEKIISENPNDAEAHYKLGEVYEFMRGEGGGLKAMECCEKAIAIDSVNTTYLAFLFYLTLNFDDQKAFDTLAKFIELWPDEGDYYTERVIDELGCVNVEFALKYIENLRKEDKEEVAHTMERWIWNP